MPMCPYYIILIIEKILFDYPLLRNTQLVPPVHVIVGVSTTRTNGVGKFRSKGRPDHHANAEVDRLIVAKVCSVQTYDFAGIVQM